MSTDVYDVDQIVCILYCNVRTASERQSSHLFWLTVAQASLVVSDTSLENVTCLVVVLLVIISIHIRVRVF